MSAGSPMTVCGSKVHFATRAEAVAAAKQQKQRVYLCPFGGWCLRSKISRRQTR